MGLGSDIKGTIKLKIDTYEVCGVLDSFDGN